MSVRLSKEEIIELRNYLGKLDAQETQKDLPGYAEQEKYSEADRIFLLLRKLLAFGVYEVAPLASARSFKDVQAQSQKPYGMLTAVHANFAVFQYLLDVYQAHHWHEST